MPGSGNTTDPSYTEDPAPGARGVRLVPSLVRIWCRDHADPIGEVAVLEDILGSSCILGRDAEGEDDLVARAAFVIQRLGENLPGSPITLPKVSRRQLRIVRVAGGLELENTGAVALLVNGHPVEQGTKPIIRPGAIIQLRGQTAFLFVMRPAIFPAPGRPLGPPHPFGEPDADEITGESWAAWYQRIAIAAAVLARGHVFIHGETGTGKELVAKAVHRLSGRKGKMLSYNAAAFPPGLTESILFGNLKGYPHSEAQERSGLLGDAGGGTLFLDEFGEMPHELQSKLLRALAEREYTRLGESKPRRLDAVVVAATNRELSAGVKKDVLKRFSYVIETPSLAHRLEDIPLIARALVLKQAMGNSELAGPFVCADARGRQQAQLSMALILAMLRGSYDGNVRDLDNLLVKAMTETAEPPILPPADLTAWRPPPTMPPPAPDLPDDAEIEDLFDGFSYSKGWVLGALVRGGWNVARTAKANGMDRDKLRRLMKKFGIRRPDGDPEPGDE